MKATRISRRRFLLVAGAGLGATALTCSGLAVVGNTLDRPAAFALPDATLGDNPMSKILVTYASTAGSTAGVAEVIARTLAESAPLAAGGAQVDLRPVGEVEDLAPYRAVVVGSAIHGSAWLPEAVQFVKKHQSELHQKLFAAFLVCMTLTMKNETYREGIQDALGPVRELVRPVSEGYFAGALDCSKLKLFPDRLVLRAIVASGTWQEGDFRDWNAIRAWARDLAPRLAA